MKLRAKLWLLFIFIVFLPALQILYAAEAGRVQMSVPSPEQLKAGENITFQALVLNEGSTSWNTRTYSAAIDIYDEKKVYKTSTESTSEGSLVVPGESALFFISFKIPEDFGGQYFYKVNLKYAGRIISTSDYYTFSVIPLISGATIAITNTIEDQKLGSNFKVTCQVKNTGETNHKFPVQLKIKTPGEALEVPIKTASLGPGQSSTINFDCSIPEQAPDGIYTVIATVYDRLESEKPVQKYDETTQEFKVIDITPTIQFLNLSLSAVKGEEINLKVRVIDDRGVQSVRINYQIPGMSQMKTQDMNLLSGTKQDGVWTFKTAAFTETGKFIFMIEATDTRAQVGRVEYQATVVTK